MGKMVKLHFLHNKWSDVSHIWQLWSLDDCLPSCFFYLMTSGYFVWLPWKHKDNSSETTESVGHLLVQILLGYGQFQIAKKFGSLPLGLVAMATESCHSLIMGKWFNCTFSITSEVMSAIFGSYDHLMIVYPVYVLWPVAILFGCHDNIQFWKGTFSDDNFKTTAAVWL